MFQTPMNSENDLAECPSPGILKLFVSSELSESSDRMVEAHVEHCPSCQAWLHEAALRDKPFFLDFEMQTGNGNGSTIEIPDIPGYELDGTRREGGQGVVFRAKELQLGRTVAIKMMKPGFFSGDMNQSSLMKEARAVARLSHENIVRLHSVGWLNNAPYLVMDWVDGGTLSDKLQRNKPSHKESVALLIQLASAIEHAHENQILHRDIKPSNIMMTGNGFDGMKITDFGLAKLGRPDGGWSTASDMVGTPVYMAPEMLLDELGQVGPAVDIYSLGAVLHLIITGKVPFEGINPFDLGLKVMRQEIKSLRIHSPGIPADLETICLKCLQKEPSDRYATVAALREDLIRFQQGRPILASRESTIRRWRRWAKREPIAAIQLGGVISFLIITIMTLVVLLRQSSRQEKIAEERLSKTVEAMRLSSPIFKRFLQGFPARAEEIQNIMNYARLRESIGAEPEDLKDRLRFHYVTLELADAIKNLKGYQSESLELSMKAREKIASFINKNRKAISEIIVFESKPDHFQFTLLEKAEIQYGHACSQIAGIYNLNQNPETYKLCEQFLNEAIQHAKIALELNPDLDEAKLNLANYYAALYPYQLGNKDLADAELSLEKSVEIMREIVDLDPKSQERWDFMIIYERLLAEYQLITKNDKEVFLQSLKNIELLLSDTRILQAPDPGLLYLEILETIHYRVPFHFSNNEYQTAVETCSNQIKQLTNLKIKPKDLRIYDRTLFRYKMNLLHLLSTKPENHDTLLNEINRTVSLISSMSDESLRNESMAHLLIFHPAPSMEYTKQAEIHIESTISSDSHINLLQSIIQIKNASAEDLIQYLINYRDGINLNYEAINDQIKCIFLIQQLIQHNKLKEARDAFELIKNVMNKNMLRPIWLTIQFDKISRLPELQTIAK